VSRSLARPAWELLGPSLVVVIVAVVGTLTSSSLEFQFRSVLVNAAIVVALYTFVGNSGVISFGHVSFVAVGAFAAGITTAPAEVKPTTFPELFGFLQDVQVGNAASLAIAAAVGGVFAFLVGIPTMLAATAYELLDTLSDSTAMQAEAWGDLALAFVAAAITGFFAVKWLLAFISSHSFTPFAYYRIVLGALLLAIL